MKTEVTYRGGSGAQGKMEVVVECGKCGGGWITTQVESWITPLTITTPCPHCNGTGREVKP